MRTSDSRDEGSKLMNLLPGMAYRCLNDEQWTMLEVSAGAEPLTGYPAEDFIGNRRISFSDLIHPDDRDQIWEDVQVELAQHGSFDLEYRIVLPGGSIKRVWEHGRGVYEEGELVELSGFIVDLTDKMKRERLYFDAQQTMVKLATSPQMAMGNVEELAQSLTEEAARLLSVQRAGVWLLNPAKDELHLLTLYDAKAGTHSNGTTLSASDYPGYFDALVSNRAISAMDAATHPYTREFTDGYLQSTGVVSMLDATIRVAGEVVGVICNEQTRIPRRWLPQDASLAGELADQIAHVLSNRKRFEVEQRVRETEAADRAKSQLLATISHELRTPMNGVLGIAELLATTDLDERQQRYVHTISDSGNLLLTIINDVLDYSKLEAGKLQLFDSETNIPEMFRSVVGVLRQSVSSGVVLNLTEGTAFPDVVMVDNHRLRQLLFNLIGNAIKFTAQGGISIYYSTLPDDRWCFDVSDTGVGISEEQLSTVFEPFGQVAESQHLTPAEGTGLGLAICRALVDCMGGEIAVSSQPGQGSCFSVTLPLVLAPSAKLDTASDVSTEPCHYPDLKVLVAEDNEVNQQVITGLLNCFGISPDITGDGAEAIAQFKRAGGYDLILMDCEMPIVDGFSATREILALPDAGPAPTIAGLSAHAMEDFKNRAREAGMAFYLTKPIQLKELGDLLQQVTAPR